jgi:hypothetical protein
MMISTGTSWVLEEGKRKKKREMRSKEEIFKKGAGDGMIKKIIPSTEVFFSSAPSLGKQFAPLTLGYFTYEGFRLKIIQQG